MSNKEFPRGQLNPTILSTLLDKDKYGYEIIDDIKEKTGIEIKQPSLYSSLKRMENQKLISSYWQDSDIGGKRHYYCLTAVGKEFLKKNPVDFSSFDNFSKEIDSSSLEKVIEKEIETKETATKEIEDKIINEEPRFAQQDNIFNSVIKEKPEEVKVENAEFKEPAEDESFKQYDLFANIKQEEPKAREYVRPRNIHKNMSDPYQLKYLGEDELKNEFEKIRNQKLGIQPAQVDKSNVWMDRTNYMESQKASALQSENLDIHIAKKEPVSDKEPVRDDARFITERINVEDLPRRQTTPSSLNIESNNYASFLNSKVAAKEELKEEKIKFDYAQSLAKLESKFKEHTENKNQSVPEPEKSFDKVNNTYERAKGNVPVLNSYKSLEAFFNSKGIGFYSYNRKEKTANQFVDYSLIKFVRGIMFSLYSIILAFAFFFGINSPSIGKSAYIIIPALALILTILYGISYSKSKKNTIIQQEKSVVSPIILPLISACAILVIIAINLAIGFHGGKELYYFPLLIYPICLAFHIALIVPLNKLIHVSVLKWREWRQKDN